jgi:hypothetical protein
MTVQGHDLVGDIHGHADALHRLLRELDYVEIEGIFRHPERQMIFVGDFVNRGPQQQEVLRIARSMCEAGFAKAVRPLPCADDWVDDASRSGRSFQPTFRDSQRSPFCRRRPASARLPRVPQRMWHDVVVESSATNRAFERGLDRFDGLAIPFDDKIRWDVCRTGRCTSSHVAYDLPVDNLYASIK